MRRAARRVAAAARLALVVCWSRRRTTTVAASGRHSGQFCRLGPAVSTLDFVDLEFSANQKSAGAMEWCRNQHHLFFESSRGHMFGNQVRNVKTQSLCHPAWKRRTYLFSVTSRTRTFQTQFRFSAPPCGTRDERSSSVFRFPVCRYIVSGVVL